MSESIGGLAPANAWLHPLASTPTLSTSERLIRGLEAHVADEAHDIAACEELASRVGDPIVRFLLRMIGEDEQRHQVVVKSLIGRLQEEVDFPPDPGDSLIPRLESVAPSDDEEELASAVRALIRDEHEGARHVRHLARQEPHSYDGVCALLLETIARDSEKHATVLKFVLHRIERSRY